MPDVISVPKRAWEIIVEARRDGWYEDHSGWRELDEIIRTVEQNAVKEG